MRTSVDRTAVDAVRLAAVPLDGGACDHDALLQLIGGAHFVLLGEASHGTHEFYSERARITQWLIAEKGFHAVVIEGDPRRRVARWPARPGGRCAERRLVRGAGRAGLRCRARP